jgi:hypothetical protein
MLSEKLSENRSQEKTRVQLDLSPAEIGRMNHLMRLADLGTRKDLFNNALSLFEWAVLQVYAGHDVGSVDKETKQLTILSMPAFSSVRAYRDAKKLESPSGGSVIKEEPIRRVIAAG